VDGLSPIAESADGTRLLAEFNGTDTSQAWTLEAPAWQPSELGGESAGLIGATISRDGSTVLATEGFLGSPDTYSVVTVPFAGGTPHVLVRGAGEPSWND
jgi:hypothetical protein